jgi:hypothetical protein
MPPSGAPLWSVTSQREDWQVKANGQAGPGMVVTFTTRSGAVGSVFIPTEEYTLDRVRALVDEKARAVEAVAGLTG